MDRSRHFSTPGGVLGFADDITAIQPDLLPAPAANRGAPIRVTGSWAHLLDRPAPAGVAYDPPVCLNTDAPFRAVRAGGVFDHLPWLADSRAARCRDSVHVSFNVAIRFCLSCFEVPPPVRFSLR